MGHESLMLSLCCVLVMVLYIGRDFRRWRSEKRKDEARRVRLLEDERKHAAECYACQARILVKGATARDAR
jgi:hypothetical protein